MKPINPEPFVIRVLTNGRFCRECGWRVTESARVVFCERIARGAPLGRAAYRGATSPHRGKVK